MILCEPEPCGASGPDQQKEPKEPEELKELEGSLRFAERLTICRLRAGYPAHRATGQAAGQKACGLNGQLSNWPDPLAPQTAIRPPDIALAPQTAIRPPAIALAPQTAIRPSDIALAPQTAIRPPDISPAVRTAIRPPDIALHPEQQPGNHPADCQPVRTLCNAINTIDAVHQPNIPPDPPQTHHPTSVPRPPFPSAKFISIFPVFPLAPAHRPCYHHTG